MSQPERAAYEVVEYSIENLDRLLADAGRTSIEGVRKKLHRIYFEGYLAELGARTIVAEFEYVDRDYFVDFAAYYVRCFRPYERWCTRLHFFATSISDAELSAYLGGEATSVSAQALQEAYLGFVVVKPLPVTLIGRTCLKAYGSDGGRRAYPATRRYSVNFFGTDLTVCSLAFQEQDHVVAACATSALWSALHCTASMFQHQLPTPSEITTAATTLEPLKTRQFPNSGLNATQMARGIRAVGLEPYFVGATDPNVLRATAFAYLRVGIPVVLVLSLVDRSDDDCTLGLHAITLAGYSMGRSKATAAAGSDFLLEASRVDKFYAHDDQVGPFSRVLVNDVVDADDGSVGCELGLSWKGRDDKLGSVVGLPRFLLVPVYHKVRIAYDAIEDAVARFDEVLHVIRNQLAANERPTWEIRLTTATDFKREVVALSDWTPPRRRELLTASLPRFLWRATAKGSDQKPLIDILFDATDLAQGEMLVEFEIQDGELRTALSFFAMHPQARDIVFDQPWTRAIAKRLVAVP